MQGIEGKKGLERKKAGGREVKPAGYMMGVEMRIVILGLSITSSWGNGHANIYRGLVRELSALSHDVLFLERDMPWFAQNRDLPEPPYCRTYLYNGIPELKKKFTGDIRDADCVMVGSCVPEGEKAGDLVTSRAKGVTAFYDMDAPVTLSYLTKNKCSYLTRKQVRDYCLYLSSTSGPTLERIEREFGSPMARALLLCFGPG